MTVRKAEVGTRVLHDNLSVAAARIEANERVAEERWTALDYRLGRIEEMLEKLEKRIWLGVYGVAAFLLTQMAEAVIHVATR
jgi:hypothetical protein